MSDIVNTTISITDANWSYDPTLVVIDAAVGALLLNNDPGQVFTEDFSDDTGFVYDNTKAQFVGGACRQKDQRPTDATFGVSYTDDINGSWGDGVLTGAAVGGAAVSGGKLVCNQSDVRYVEYDAALNGNSGSKGCIKFKYTPNYSNAPGVNIGLMGESNGVLIPDSLFLYHTAAGQLWFTVYCGAVATVSIASPWLPTSGTEYEISLNWNTLIGEEESKVFIQGTQHGATSSGVGVRAAVSDSIKIGATYDPSGTVSNALFDDVIFYDSPQNTVNYTPGYTVPENDYVETSVILPEMKYTGTGTLISFDTFLTTQIGTLKYTLQIGRSGNYLYWDGAAWSVSDGSYAQSTSKVDFNTNLASLPILGEIYGQFKIHFTDLSTQSSISELIASLTAQIYPTTNPTLTYIGSTLSMASLISFTESITVTGSDLVRFILKSNGVYVYHNGTAWVASDLSLPQTNSGSEITLYASTLSDESYIELGMLVLLHSNDGSTTPCISAIDLSYYFHALVPDSSPKCIVFGYIYDIIDEPTEDISITVQAENIAEYNSEKQITTTVKTIETDPLGYWQISLFKTEDLDPETYFIFIFKDTGFNLTKTKKIPDEDDINFLLLDDK